MYANYIIAYILWAFGGNIGIHRFYVGRWKTGLLYLLTNGLMGIGFLIDFFLIPQFVESFNSEAKRVAELRQEKENHIWKGSIRSPHQNLSLSPSSDIDNQDCSSDIHSS